MKTAFILAGAITLVLMSMEGPASASPAPSTGATKVLNDLNGLKDILNGHERRLKRSLFGDIGSSLGTLTTKFEDFEPWVDNY